MDSRLKSSCGDIPGQRVIDGVAGGRIERSAHECTPVQRTWTLEREPKIRARPGHIDWREQVADRLEGRPVPKLQQPVPHATYFYKAGGPTPCEVESADHDHAPLQTAHPEVAEGDDNVPGYISVPPSLRTPLRSVTRSHRGISPHDGQAARSRGQILLAEGERRQVKWADGFGRVFELGGDRSVIIHEDSVETANLTTTGHVGTAAEDFACVAVGASLKGFPCLPRCGPAVQSLTVPRTKTHP
jgi:hypothetical protein